jgi:hypothetical protein
VSWIENLKRRWNVDSAGKVWIILCVFALTGTTVMLLRRFLKSEFDWAHEKWFTYSYYWLILPFYNVILLMYGAIFGQFRFFWEFEKRFFRRLVNIFKRKP